MLEDSASSGRSSSNHLDQPAGEREARAQEHARISAEIERIMAACENEEAAMIRKSPQPLASTWHNSRGCRGCQACSPVGSP
uniref:Uncharacterized protein n=1 Tax=Brassica campestris TaxID=3711 RepID=A0A3P6DUW2_BRACM|nr:unnamed protein product [Brassica rapa]